MTDPSQSPALVLNADYQPLSVLPLSTWSWEDAVSAVVADRVSVVAEYDREVRSPTVTMRLPSVIALREYQDLERPAPLRRINLYILFGGRCAYCGIAAPSEEMTFEHVVPRARGGVSSWTNLALACVPCNARKGSRTPAEAGMRLLQVPRRPTVAEVNRLAARLPLTRLRRTALDNAYWRAFLEP